MDDLLGFLDQIETRFETLVEQYGIQMEDASHIVMHLSFIRAGLENL